MLDSDPNSQKIFREQPVLVSFDKLNKLKGIVGDLYVQKSQLESGIRKFEIRFSKANRMTEEKKCLILISWRVA